MNQSHAPQAAEQDPIYEAIQILVAEAESIRESHTHRSDRDDWAGEPEAKADYERMLGVAAALSKLRAEGVQVGDEREAFEKYAARAGYPLTGRELGHYSNIRTRNNWMGWQARAALASAPVADDWPARWEAMRHAGNEWADMACNAISWVRNVQEGICTADDAMEGLKKNLTHCRATQARVSVASAPVAGEAQPVAWMVDWPDEPDLGHTLLEDPVPGARNRALVIRDAAPQASTEPLARYCPGCGSVGPVGDEYRDCCPDGNQARMIPARLAEKCRDTFRLAIQTLLADAAANDSAAPQASAAVRAESDMKEQ